MWTDTNPPWFVPVGPRAADGCSFPILLVAALAAGLGSAAAAADTVADCQRETASAEIALEESVLSGIRTVSSGDVAATESTIAAIEKAGGPLDSRLASPLLALGLARREARQDVEATAAFYRALFVVRAGEGLYSRRQIPIVNLLIESRAGAGDWRGVADAYDLLVWIYRRNFGPTDAGQLPGLRRLHRWYVDAYNKDTGRSLEELFASNERVTRLAEGIIERCGGDRERALCYLDASCCTEPLEPSRSCAGTENFAPGNQSKITEGK